MPRPPQPNRQAFMANLVFDTEDLSQEDVLNYIQLIFQPCHGITPELSFNWKDKRVTSVGIRLRRAL